MEVLNQIRIPKVKIQEIRDSALKVAISSAESAGWDRDLIEEFKKLVPEIPINDELIPAGILVYIFTIEEAVRQKFIGWEHIITWLMLPFWVEFKRIPEVAGEMRRLEDRRKGNGTG